MTKRKTAEKYLRDGGCGTNCIKCSFGTKCFKKHWYCIKSEYGLELAKEYLAKKDRGVVHVKADEVFSVDMLDASCRSFVELCTKKEKKMEKDDGWKDLTFDTLPMNIDLSKDPREQYDIECSLFDGKWGKTLSNEWMSILVSLHRGTLKYRYRSIQKAPVSHEEIMTKWWQDGDRWYKVTALIRGNYYISHLQEVVPKYWFNNRKSATIPPEPSHV